MFLCLNLKIESKHSNRILLHWIFSICDAMKYVPGIKRSILREKVTKEYDPQWVGILGRTMAIRD